MGSSKSQEDWEDVEGGWEDVEAGWEDVPTEKAAPAPFTPDPTATRITPRKYTGPVEYGPLSQLAASVPIAGSGAKFLSNKLRSVFDRNEGETFSEASERHNKKFMSDREAFEADYPLATPVAGVAGSLAFPAFKAAGALGKWVGAPLYNAVEGAIDNYLMKEDTEEAADAGLFSGAMTTGMNALGAAGKLVGKAARRFITGVSGDTAEHYLKNADRVNSRDLAKTERDFLNLKGGINELATDTKRLAKEAKEDYNWAVNRETDRLTALRDFEDDQTAVNLAKQLAEAIPDLGKRLDAGAKDSVKALQKDVPQAPWAAYSQEIDNQIKALLNVGRRESDSTVQTLRDLQKRVQSAQNAPAGSPAAVKDLLTELSDKGRRGYDLAAEGGRVPADTRAIQGVREYISSDLKARSKSFAEIMERQQKLASLKDEVAALAGDPKQVAGRLKDLDNPLKSGTLDTLSELEKLTGKNYRAVIEKNLEAGRILGSKEANLYNRQSLPEYLESLKAERRAENLGELSGKFGINLRSTLKKAGQEPDNQVAQDALKPISRHMRENLSELARDLEVQRALGKEGNWQGRIPINLVQGVNTLLGGVRSNYGPQIYKSIVDKTLLNDKYMRVYNPVRRGLDYAPRAAVGAMSRTPDTEEEYEDYVRRRP